MNGIIRPERPDDSDEVRALVTLAMGPSEAQLVELIRASEHYVADLALVAEEAGRILGHVLFSNVALEGREVLTVLALAPLCVHPERQRQGIGSALVRAGLERADARGAPLVVVLGHPGYYPRFGFEPARRYGIEHPFPHVEEGAFMVRPLASYRDRYTGRVVYPSAFDVT
jgi:putative acetyltransferase